MTQYATGAAGLGLPDEVPAVLERHPDVEAVHLVITDANGEGNGYAQAGGGLPLHWHDALVSGRDYEWYPDTA